MSYSFYVASPAHVAYSAVVSGLGLEDVRDLEGTPADDRWVEGFHHHFYRVGLSARGVEVCREDERFEVRLMTCASRDEYDLAFRIVDRIVGLTGTSAFSEEAVEFVPQTRAAHYGGAWIDETIRVGAGTLLRMVDDGHGPLSLSGPVRTFRLGDRVVQSLRAEGPEDTIGDRLLEKMQTLQWLPRDGWVEVPMRRLIAEGQAEEDAYTVASFAPGTAALLPPVDLLEIAGTEPLFVASEAALDLVPSARWLDDGHVLVPAIGRSDWPGLIDRLRPLAVDIA
jgi:hypothetical protein